MQSIKFPAVGEAAKVTVVTAVVVNIFVEFTNNVPVVLLVTVVIGAHVPSPRQNVELRRLFRCLN